MNRTLGISTALAALSVAVAGGAGLWGLREAQVQRAAATASAERAQTAEAGAQAAGAAAARSTADAIAAGEALAAAQSAAEASAAELLQAQQAALELTQRAATAEAATEEAAALARLYGAMFTEAAFAVREVGRAAGAELQPFAKRVASELGRQGRRVKNEAATARAEFQFAEACRDLKLFADAETHYRAALVPQRKVLGEAHADTLATLAGLAAVLREQAQWDEAISTQVAVVEGRRADPDESAAKARLSSLITTCMLAARFAEAEPWARELVGEPPADSPLRGLVRTRIAEYLLPILQAEEKFSEAESFARALRDSYVEEGDDYSQGFFEAWVRLAWLLRLQDRAAEAAAMHTELMTLAQFMANVQRPYPSRVFGEYLLALGDHERALAALQRHLEAQQRLYADDAGVIWNPTWAALAQACDGLGKTEEAATWRAKIVEPPSPRARPGQRRPRTAP